MPNHSFIDYPPSGPNAGLVSDLSPAADAGTAPDAVHGSLKRLADAVLAVPAAVSRNGQPGDTWVDDPSIAGSLASYVDSADLAGSVGTSLASWPDRQSSGNPYVQATTNLKPDVVIGRTGKPAVRFASQAGAFQRLTRASLTLSNTPGLTLVFVYDNYQPHVSASSPVLAESTGTGGDNALWGVNNSVGYPSVAYGVGNNALTNPIGMTVLVIRQTGTTADIWLNGVKGATGGIPFNQTGLSGLTLGGSVSAIGPVADWYLTAAYTGTALTDGQINSLNAALVRAYVQPAPIDPARDLLVYLGDSRKWGVGADYYTQAFADQVNPLLTTPAVQTVVEAIPGTVATNGANAPGVQAAVRLAARGRKNQVAYIGWGVNDAGGGRSASQIYADLRTVSTTLRAVGYKTVVETVAKSANIPSDANTQIDALNVLLLAQDGITTDFDEIADTAAVVVTGNALTPAYSADGLHINGAGNGVQAPVAATAINGVFAA